jgi:hypothetical protein
MQTDESTISEAPDPAFCYLCGCFMGDKKTLNREAGGMMGVGELSLVGGLKLGYGERVYMHFGFGCTL